MGCWADRPEEKAAKHLGKEKWKGKWYTANEMRQKSHLFVTTTIFKCHQGNHQEIFSFSWFTKSERRERGEKTNTTNEQKYFDILKLEGIFIPTPCKLKNSCKTKASFVLHHTKKEGGTMGRRHLENFYTHLLQKILLRTIRNAFATPKNNHFWLLIILRKPFLLGVIFLPNQTAA